MKVDVESLKSLGSLGIDVEFLSELEEEIMVSQHDYGIGAALQQSYQLIQKLHKEQQDR